MTIYPKFLFAIAAFAFSFSVSIPSTYSFHFLFLTKAQAQPVSNQVEIEQLYEEGQQLHDNAYYQDALESYEKALLLSRQSVIRLAEGNILNAMGAVYEQLGRYSEALSLYQQTLAVRQSIEDLEGIGNTLNNIGEVYRQLGHYDLALEALQRSLTVRQQIDDRLGEGDTFTSMGSVYNQQGHYLNALTSYEQALEVFQIINDDIGRATVFGNLGGVYSRLGQYSRALDFYNKSLLIFQRVNDRLNEANVFNNIGFTQARLSQYAQALQSYHQAVRIYREIKYQPGEALTLNNIGFTYSQLSRNSDALAVLKQALQILQTIDDKAGEGKTLDSIGTVYRNLGQYTQAMEFYQQALLLLREVSEPFAERTNLSNIGDLLVLERQPELAIIFYKQSINISEKIRQDLHGLSQDQKESYTQTVANTYRNLADLLLQQNRVLEAQRVLDLLKVQELNDYLHNVRGNDQTAQGVEILRQEQNILDQYKALQNQSLQHGRELTQIRQIPPERRTSEQQQRVVQLDEEQRALTHEFVDFTRLPEIVASIEQLSHITGGQNLNPANLRNTSDELREINQDAVLLYPLVLDDRIELILASPDAPPIRRTVSIRREDLNRAIVSFRQALEDPNADAKTPAHQLYDWLIKPIENDLAQTGAQTIIYAPDGQLRYIPLAALYDGNQWLVQRFRINNITSLSLTNFTHQPQATPHIIAGAFSQGSFTVQAEDRTLTFNGLQFAGQEVSNIATLVPQTTTLLNQDFSEAATLPQLDDYNIIHFATHAAFFPGRTPSDSFILFGNGDRVTLEDIDYEWRFRNVDLVVLSACETGLGGISGNNGEEILGFGYLMQNAGARAAIASLWSVSDGGTQALMESFYAALRKDDMTKAEALRQAQIALITSNYEALENQQRGIVGVRQRIREGIPSTVINRLSHPYYWAPFILIGNGL